MSKIYVMTDIHGRLAMLRALLAQIPDGSKLVFLGDHVDRGSERREVVALIRSLPNAICLRGDHEDMLCSPQPRRWLESGGASIVVSYKHPLTGRLDVPALQADMNWMARLPRFHSDAHRVYVHAGADDQLTEMFTQRFRYLAGADIGWRGLHVVHGHTPGVLTLTNRTCLDAGMAQMACGVFDDDTPGGPVEMLWA